MSLLFKNAQVFNPDFSERLQKSNILVEDGRITSFSGLEAEEEVDLEGKVIYPGWFDLNAHFNDPGLEYKEDLVSGSEVAIKGGFTDVQLFPNTSPPLETKSDVSYVLQKSISIVDLHVSAALSEGLKGENLTEIYDLRSAGVTSFTDGDLSIWNSKLLLKALQYTSKVEATIFQTPRDLALSEKTQMHEGKVSTFLGLPGEPSVSEELIIMRDIEILKYSGGSLHFSRVSSGHSIEIIRRAKAEGLKVTCDTSIHQLLFTDEDLTDFNTNFKNVPPYRTESDRQALIQGVVDGTIDAICSNHRPQDQENKDLEFDLAEPGSISLQTFYSSLLKLFDVIPEKTLVECISSKPRKVLGLEEAKIEEGAIAKMTIVDPYCKWTLDDSTNLSKSRNSPFWEQELTGKVVGLVNRDAYQIFR